MAYTINPFTGKFDYYLGTDVLDDTYLKLSGSNANQNISIGSYSFSAGTLYASDTGTSVFNESVTIGDSLSVTNNITGQVISAYGTTAQPYIYAFPQNDLTKYIQFWHSGAVGVLQSNYGDMYIYTALGNNLVTYNPFAQINIVSSGTTPAAQWIAQSSSNALGSGNHSLIQQTIEKDQSGILQSNGLFQNIFGDYCIGTHVNLDAAADSAWGFIIGLHGTNQWGLMFAQDDTNNTSTPIKIFQYGANASATQDLISIRAGENYAGTPTGAFTGDFLHCALANVDVLRLSYDGKLQWGVGGLTGALGYDGAIYSDTTSLYMKVESPHGAGNFIYNPALKITYSTLIPGTVTAYVPLITSKMDGLKAYDGYFLFEHGLYCVGSDDIDGEVVVTSKGWVSGTSNLHIASFFYDTDNDYAKIDTTDMSVTGASLDLHLTPSGGLVLEPEDGDIDMCGLGGDIEANAANFTTTGAIQGEQVTSTDDMQASGKLRLVIDGSSSDNYISSGASDDLKLYHDGTNSYITNATGALIFDNDNVLTANSTGKEQFYGEFIPTSSPSSTAGNYFKGNIDLRGCSPASNADFIGNNFTALYQSNDTTAGFPAISFIGTKFVNTLNLNSSGSPRFQTGDFKGVFFDIDYTGSYSTVAGFNAIPMTIDVDFTATCAASHQLVGLSLTNTYNANNSINQNIGLQVSAEQVLGTLVGNLTAVYGTISVTTPTLSSDASIFQAYTANISSALDTALAAGKKLIHFYSKFDAFGNMTNQETYAFYTSLVNHANNLSFVSDGADGLMYDNVAWKFGTGGGLGSRGDCEIVYTGTYWDFDILIATSAIRFNQAKIDTDFIVYGDNAALITLDAGTGGMTIGGGVAGYDQVITVDGETNDGVITWMEDEDYFKFSDDILMNSTEKLYFNDTSSYIYDNGTDLILASNGAIHTEQVMEALGYEAGGIAGITENRSFTDADGNEHAVTITGGIITAWVVTAP